MIEKTPAASSNEPMPARDGQYAYVAPLSGANEWGDDFDLIELWKVIWQGRLFVLVVTLLVVAIGLGYAMLASEWYRAEVVLIPAKVEPMQGMSSQFGGLASLAGLKLGGEDNAEPLAVLRSKGFVRDFIEDEKLASAVLVAKMNPVKGLAIEPDGEPDIREAVEFFIKRILRIAEDRKTGIVTVAIEWNDPETAASWANRLAERLNERMRARTLTESSANIAFLRSELAATSAVTLQDSIGRLLEMELQKAMLAKGNREFSYRVVDPASAPRKRAWPKRSLILALSFVLGIALSFAALIIRHSVRAHETTAS